MDFTWSFFFRTQSSKRCSLRIFFLICLYFFELEINRTENRAVPSTTSEVKQLVTRNNGCSLLLTGSSRLTEHVVFLLLLRLRPNQSPRVTTLMVDCYFFVAVVVFLNQGQVTFAVGCLFFPLLLRHRLTYAYTKFNNNLYLYKNE